MKYRILAVISTFVVLVVFLVAGCGKREKTVYLPTSPTSEPGIKTSYDPSSVASHKVYSTVAVDFDVDGNGVIDANDKPKYMGSGACKVCHADEYEEYTKTHHSMEFLFANREGGKVKSGKVSGTCVNCHTVGYSDAAKGITEESGFNDPARTNTEKYGAGTATDYGLQGIGCESCHGPASAHIVAVGKGKAPKNYINGVPDPAETCQRCHQSGYRSLAVSLTMGPAYEDTGTLTGVGIIRKDATSGKYYVYPPHIRQSMFFEGVGGYEFPPFSADGKSFNGTLGTDHANYPDNYHTKGLSGKCITCHLFGNAAKGGKDDATVHDLEPDLNACKVCHTGATNFDIFGRKTELTEDLHKLKEKIDAFATVKCGSADCYLSKDGAGATTNAADANLLIYARAYANWEVVEAPGAYGIHNFQYAKKLVDDAYAYITCIGLGSCASGYPKQ